MSGTIVLGLTAAAGASTSCSANGSWIGCPPPVQGSIGNGRVELDAWERIAGAPSSEHRSDPGGGHGSNSDRGGDPRGTPSWCSAGICGWAPPSTAEPADPGTPGVTIEDIASFAPAVPAGSMEPGPGIAVRRLPANFISHATEQVVSAPLLGRPAEVRFTPVFYVWDTGDGGRVESAKPGRTWAKLRVKELTDTATSHRYQERGYYDVRPTVTFEAAYRFDGSGWTTVGELDIAAAPTRVRVVTVETRLTRGSCLDYPDDPGCR
ncbi:hypothetical protein [Agromyces aerolatus]|uniref:hypothetical protein n=1 Tax=Agromyces sp. LY-1074 TaxID=3074080 RepID=UPI00285464CB|nr:hypothetical protein [Agromyces sp. LY-1358]MDR5704563.1 hypothetical protein [Agromyces sp. LY-1358]